MYQSAVHYDKYSCYSPLSFSVPQLLAFFSQVKQQAINRVQLKMDFLNAPLRTSVATAGKQTWLWMTN